MLKPVIHSHTHDAGYRWPVVASLIGHTLLLLFFLFAVKIFPAGEPLLIGSGLGGGQGEDSVTVGLSPELSGGAGMYKPSVTPQPAALPPPAPRKTAETESPATQPENVFPIPGHLRRVHSARFFTPSQTCLSLMMILYSFKLFNSILGFLFSRNNFIIYGLFII